MKRDPLLHIRIIAPDEHIEELTRDVETALEEKYNVLEVTLPRPIQGDIENKKVYISVCHKKVQ